jgi:hypothetical protein
MRSIRLADPLGVSGGWCEEVDDCGHDLVFDAEVAEVVDDA